MKILLRGYYGRGNWGDDLLMLITFRILRETYPAATIFILTADRPSPYIKALLGEDVPLLMQGHHGHFDMIVDGGGGVFFDFRPQPWPRRLVQSALSLLGYRQCHALETLIRKLIGKPRTSCNSRFAMGVGVGTFTKGSPALANAIHAFCSMRAMWVRDVHSQRNLQRFRSVLDAPVILGSDMVFMRNYWLEDERSAEKPTTTKPRIGVVLRDWPEANAGILNATKQTLEALKQRYEITLFCLEEEADAPIINALASLHPIVWQPERMIIAQFTQQLAQQQVIVTSRAHGAICAACLGIASVILEIEPKLRRVHEMLPRSSSLLPLSALHGDAAIFEAAIDRALQCSADLVEEDVLHNNGLSQAALTAIRAYFPKGD